MKTIAAILFVGTIALSFATAKASPRPSQGDPQGLIYGVAYGQHVPSGR